MSKIQDPEGERLAEKDREIKSLLYDVWKYGIRYSALESELSEQKNINQRLIDSYEINREAMLAELSRLKSRLDEAEKVIEAATFVLVYRNHDTFESKTAFNAWADLLDFHLRSFIAKRSEQQEGE